MYSIAASTRIIPAPCSKIVFSIGSMSPIARGLMYFIGGKRSAVAMKACLMLAGLTKMRRSASGRLLIISAAAPPTSVAATEVPQCRLQTSTASFVHTIDGPHTSKPCATISGLKRPAPVGDSQFVKPRPLTSMTEPGASTPPSGTFFLSIHRSSAPTLSTAA
jgi:hypothetical protein